MHWYITGADGSFNLFGGEIAFRTDENRYIITRVKSFRYASPVK